MLEESLGAQRWGRKTYFPEGKGLCEAKRGNTCPPAGRGSSWSFDEVRIFFVESDSARGNLERKWIPWWGIVRWASMVIVWLLATDGPRKLLVGTFWACCRGGLLVHVWHMMIDLTRLIIFYPIKVASIWNMFHISTSNNCSISTYQHNSNTEEIGVQKHGKPTKLTC